METLEEYVHNLFKPTSEIQEDIKRMQCQLEAYDGDDSEVRDGLRTRIREFNTTLFVRREIVKDIFEVLEGLDELQKMLEIKLAYTERDAINNWDTRIAKVEDSIRGVKCWRDLYNSKLMDISSVLNNIERVKEQTNF